MTSKKRYIVFEFSDDGASADAVLLEDRAPSTCDAVRRHLPLDAMARHAIYSGSEIYAVWPRAFTVPPENATSDVHPGDIAYYYAPGGDHYGFADDLCEVCLFYDVDSSPRMAGGSIQVNVFARMVGDCEPLFEVCRRMRLEGQKRLYIRVTES
jgi:hypothetical protein